MQAEQNLKQTLLTELGYINRPGLMTPTQAATRRPIPGIENVYVVNNIQVAYFSQMLADETAIWELYERVWNESKVPLLYVFLPHGIRVYNGYAEPAKSPADLDDPARLLRHFSNLIDLEDARQQITTQLDGYRPIHLDTGAFWTSLDGQKIQREHRADHRLLRELAKLRRDLLDLDLDQDVAYTLIGRTIFICYLEDRRILTNEMTRELTSGKADTFRLALSDLQLTIDFFDSLSERFQGDLFPVSQQEHTALTKPHIELLAKFLTGEDLDTGQGVFWPYNFEFIPIELISGIYDTFFKKAEQAATGAYYTPLPLVDFVLQQTLSPESMRSDMAILDPACGSGVFLVRAFHQLVDAWYKGTSTKAIDVASLSEILQKGIFGTDINATAINISKFSLYLAMLDQLDPIAVQDPEFRFPSLRNNLLAADFFDQQVDKQFSGRKFDRIVGNLPWGENTLTPLAQQWLVTRGYINTVADKQASQAFLLRMPDFCTADGEIAVLAPTRSTIASKTGVEFRRRFWGQSVIRAIMNFSALVYELFAQSRSPAIALFYKPGIQDPASPILYGVPKPSPISHQLGAIVLDSTEVKYLKRQEIVNEPSLLKTAMWGTTRDANLIRALRMHPTLSTVAEQRGWLLRAGMTAGGKKSKRKKKEAIWLQGRELLDTEKLQPYVRGSLDYTIIRESYFSYPCSEELFEPPVVLMRQSPDGPHFVAALSLDPIVYTHNISGVVGSLEDEALLKWLVAYINSPLASYYQFLTSTYWAVERTTILHGEFGEMPFIVPDAHDPRLSRVVEHFDAIVGLYQNPSYLDKSQWQSRITNHGSALAELVFDIYDLTPLERQLVRDTVDYGIGFFYWSKHKHRQPNSAPSVQAPTLDILSTYAETFIKAATELLHYRGMTVNAVVHHDGQPLSIVGFHLVQLADHQPTHIVESSGELRRKLHDLDTMLLQQHTDSLYTRRHVRIYDGSRIDFVRPSERRFWSQSQAQADADGVIADIIRQSRVREMAGTGTL